MEKKEQGFLKRKHYLKYENKTNELNGNEILRHLYIYIYIYISRSKNNDDCCFAKLTEQLSFEGRF